MTTRPRTRRKERQLENELAERLQDDLDFWRRTLNNAREERAHLDETIKGYLDLINAVKIEAKLKGIEIQ